MKKNTATKWIVFAFDRTDNTPKTGDAANITANVRIDGGAANAVDDTNPTELEDGYYVFDITDAECNGDLIVICPASTTADIQVIGVPGAVWTDTLAADIAALPTDADVNAACDTAISDAALATAAALATVDGIVDDILVDTAVIGALGAGLTALATQASVDDIPTVAEFEARTLVAADYTVVADLPVPPTAADVADAVWDEPAGDHIAALSQGAALSDVLVDTSATLDAKIDSILADTGTDLPAAVAAVQADTTAILMDTGTSLNDKIDLLQVDTTAILVDTGTDIPAAVALVQADTTAILADTDELETDWVNGGRLDLLLDSAVGANPTAEDIADAVWDEAMADHVAAGSFGEGVANAASAGDPWSTPIPGAYGAGTAGKKISDMAAEVTAVLVDTGTDLPAAVAAVKADTAAILVDTGTTLDAALAVVDANVDAILADTGTDLPALIAALPAGSAPTAAAIADAVWDEDLSTGHAVADSAAVLLSSAAAGLATSIAGLGAIANVITVTVSDVAVQGVDVWVTSDEAGTTVVAGTLQTDVNGQVTFYLDAGTYYVWQQKTGYNFTCPDELTVT